MLNRKQHRTALFTANCYAGNASIRRVAKNIVKKVPRGRRDVLYKLIDAKSLLGQTRYIKMNLDEQTRRRLAAHD
ncbi:hypothetical protein ACTORR_01155 [Pseudomonas sp. SAR267]|uniref:hypothetical protein n=1 Tax=Pseudomonas sp. SAR267 TaxID=3454502 RepID=UPI003F93612C